MKPRTLKSLVFTSVILSLMIAGSALAADKVYELHYLTPQVGSEPSAEIIETLVAEWNEMNAGVAKVIIDGVPNYAQYLDTLKTKIAANQGPDFFYYNDLIDREEFWAKGKLGNITPYIDDEMLEADSEVDWEECKIGDQYYAIPYIKMSTMIFYNKEIFKEAGIEAPIATWDAFFEAGDKIKALGYHPFAGMSGDNNAWTTMLMYSTYVGSAGGPKILKNIKDLKDPAFLEGAKMLQKLGEYVTPDAVGAAYPVAAANFLSGKTAMIANGPWMIAQIKEEGMYEKTGYMPYPGVTGKGVIVQAGPVGKMSTFVGNEKDPEKMRAIVSFMKYHNSLENSKRMVLASAGAYATRATFTDDDPMEPMLKDLYGWVNKVDWTIPYFSEATTPFWDAGFTEELGKLWTGQTTPEEFVANMEEKTFPQ